MDKYTVILFLLLFAFTANAQKIDEKEAILSVLNQQQTAWNNGDIEGYMQGYLKSDSLMFLGKSGPTYGWHNTLDNYKKSYPDKSAMGKLTFDIRDIEMLSDSAAFVKGKWHLQRRKDEPQGFFTLVLEKIKGEWKVTKDHSSSSN